MEHKFHFCALLFSLLAAPVCPALQKADIVIVNANVVTMDRKTPRAEAIAIKDGRFVAVGSSLEIERFIGPLSNKIDAGGKLVLPGFNDAHVHFAAIGNKFSSIDLRAAKSSSDIVSLMAEYVRFLPQGRWILGSGFDPEATSDGLLSAVDAVTPQNPVFVYSPDGSSAFANSVALAKAKVARGPAGSASGFVSGNAMQTIASAVPRDHTRNWPEIIETAANFAASFGVTSVQDMHSDELADVYRQLDRAGKLKTRVYDCSPISAVAKLAASGVKAANGDSMVRTGCVKGLSEGDESEAAELQREITAADKARLQVMIHAIGPRANAIVLDAFENAARVNGKRDRRFRVEHAQNAAAADITRFRRADVIASMQPWLFNGSDPGVYKRHQELGTRLAFGSDASITDFNPFLGIQAATNGVGALSIEEAVYAYTAGGAYAEFQEKVKGTIEVGKLADLVLVDKDIFRLPVSQLHTARVTATFVGGVQVYGSR